MKTIAVLFLLTSTTLGADFSAMFAPREAVVQSANLQIPKVERSPEAAPTPWTEVGRVLNLLPEPQKAFVDFGCGDQARWVIAAAEKWQCKCFGIEIDPTRAAMARERVRDAGLSHLITIINGDAATTDVVADVAGLFLYEGTLKQLRPKLETMRAVASYRHQVPGMAMTKNGDTWLWNRPQPTITTMQLPKYAVYNGQTYLGPNPGCNCSMCQEIVRQLSTPVPVTTPVQTPAPKAAEVPKQVAAVQSRPQAVWIPGTCSRRGCSAGHWAYRQ